MTSENTPAFDSFQLAPAILKAVQEVGYETPSPIQAASIPPLLEGKDLLGMAQTGTGKTAAFALPLLSRIDTTLNQPQLLVLAPTRELAIQVAEAMQSYSRHLKNFHVLPIYGGQSYSTQLRQLKRGVQVVVGTPGRVLDHLDRGTLKLDALQALVLDEADEMLRMGFIDDVETVMAKSPEDKQVALFSATMPKEIKRIAQQYLKDVVEIKIKNKTSTVETITQRYWQVTGTHKLDALTRILEIEAFNAMIIFVRTRTATVELAEKLEARGYAAAALNGDMNQQLRERTVQKLKDGGLDIIIATDVAARGLDVERISHVLNYDIPTDTEAYVHRIGRTGRAGRQGEAILFVSPREKRMLRAIEKATRQPIEPMQLPSHEAVTDQRVARFKAEISQTLEAEQLEFFEHLVNDYAQEHDTGMSEVAAALAFLLQKGRPLQAVKEKSMAREKGKPARGERRQDDFSGKGKGKRKERKPASVRDNSIPMEQYRIEVGREHNVEPKNIVGAIANEADVESRFIGSIELHDDYSLVDLPAGMPNEVMRILKKAWVCGRRLDIKKVGESAPARSSAPKGKKKKPRAKAK